MRLSGATDQNPARTVAQAFRVLAVTANPVPLHKIAVARQDHAKPDIAGDLVARARLSATNPVVEVFAAANPNSHFLIAQRVESA